MELFQIKRSGPLKGSQPLYVRVEDGHFDPLTGAMEMGTVLSLDTYFNSFSCSQYLYWTRAEAATAELVCDGSFRAELWACRDGKDELLNHIEGRNQVKIPFDFSKEGKNCRYWIRLTAKETCRFQGGRYWTTAEPQRIHIALIVCTYRREAYLLRNLDILIRNFSTHIGPQADFEIFVVDNGNTLFDRFPCREGFWLFPNKNLGGSGGFTRGLMEVLRRRNEFTHVLLMDDDVVLESNALWKTVQFLKILRPQYQELQLAGGMLDLDSPLVQYEATARWEKGRIHSLKQGLSFDDRQALIQNEKKEHATYGAWWYLCMSLSQISRDNLPFPFFIKCDDVEYGLRNMSFITTLNGIGVWHQGFASKYAPWIDYYMARNSMILSALYPQNGNGVVTFLWKRSLSNLAMDIPQAQIFLKRAVEDFKRGPEFFLQTDMEEIHRELSGILPGKICALSKRRRVLRLFSKVFTVMFWRGLIQAAFLTVEYCKIRSALEKEYCSHWKALITWCQWEQRLNLSSKPNDKDVEEIK